MRRNEFIEDRFKFIHAADAKSMKASMLHGSRAQQQIEFNRLSEKSGGARTHARKIITPANDVVYAALTRHRSGAAR